MTLENLNSQAKFLKLYIHTDREQFRDMPAVVDVDEKWFYLSKCLRKYYLFERKKNLIKQRRASGFRQNSCSRQLLICPQRGVSQQQYSNRKLDICPFITTNPAKRSSRNTPAGTLVTMAMTSATQRKISTVRSGYTAVSS